MSESGISSYQPVCSFADWATASVDMNLFETLTTRLGAASEGRGHQGIRWAQDRILRASAFETGAVEDLYAEGATQSVAMEVAGWEGDLAASGDGAENHFEDQLAAYVFVRDRASAENDRPLLEVDVRELHRIATQSQKTHPVQTPSGIQQQAFNAGVYKSSPNQVVNRGGNVLAYAPVEDVAPEMGQLMMNLRSEEFSAAHPVIQSAYMHWAIAHIHPFSDGNGRMARVIGSMPLLQHYGIPLVVFAGRKRGYLQALEAADQHKHQEMVDYVAARASETLSWLAELLEGATAEVDADESLASIAQLLEAQAGKLETRKEAAARVQAAAAAAIKKQCSIRFTDTKMQVKIWSPDGYTSPISSFYENGYTKTDGEIRVSLSLKETVDHVTIATIQTGFTDDPQLPPVRVGHDLRHDGLSFSLEDCSPDLSVGAELRLGNFASTLVSDLTKTFQRDLAGIFKQHGRLPTHS